MIQKDKCIIIVHQIIDIVSSSDICQDSYITLQLTTKVQPF